MAVKNLGEWSGFIAIGEVVDAENDPSQSGMVRVRWKTGSAVQDQLRDDELPWTRTMFPSTNPAVGQTGGPHTGLRRGSTVVGIPLDGTGQDYLVVGTIVRSGRGGDGRRVVYDSDLPQPAKMDENGGQTQPRYGDVNGVVTQGSIVQYAESAARFASIDDAIGGLDEIIK